MKYFYPERPRLLHIEQPLFEQLSRDIDWVAEPKYNGSRLMLHHLPDDSWQFWGRHGELLTYQPNEEVREALAGLRLKGWWLFDGELRHNKVKGIQNRIVLWDVFVTDGVMLLNQVFSTRRGILETILHYSGPYDHYNGYDVIDSPPQFDKEFKKVFESYLDNQEIEGLVLKNQLGKLNLSRTSGQDSAWMWKVRKPSGRAAF